LVLLPLPVSAKDEGLLPAEEVARRLHAVPVFALVDETGVPFAVFGEDAKVTVYFFVTYGEAERILHAAKTSSDSAIEEARRESRLKRKKEGRRPLTASEEEEEIGANPWAKARISAVPLDFAVTLATKFSRPGAYFRLAPAQEDAEEALKLSPDVGDLPEGRVPLFYFDDFQLDTDTVPLYFRASQLLTAWFQKYPNEKRHPKVQVTELISVVREMVKPGGTDKDYKKLYFQPPQESQRKAEQCLLNGGPNQPFQLGQRILVL